MEIRKTRRDHRGVVDALARLSAAAKINNRALIIFLSAMERPFDAIGCVGARESIARPIP
jgi:hypothetical protein